MIEGPGETVWVLMESAKLMKKEATTGNTIRNTFFKGKLKQRLTRRHPRYKHWLKLYIIIEKKSYIGTFIHSRSYHSADSDTDYALVRAKVKLKLYKLPEVGTSKTKLLM